jgi:hypothetical protein
LRGGVNLKDIDKSIESIKGIITTLADLLREIDEQREKDKKKMDKRISALEHSVYTRAYANRTETDV